MNRKQDHIFVEWMKEHLPVLHRISRAFADPSDQHDLLQELMLAVWRAAPAFRGDSSPATFIYRVAHNRAITWRKRASGWRARSAAAEKEAAGMRSDTGEGEEDGALLDRLYAAIRMLGPIDRSVILLSLEGMSYRDISAVHGLSESNVGARLSRARAKISSLVEEGDSGL